MNLLKICSLILFYFLSRVVFAANCETYRSAASSETLCWNDSIKGWISESCSKKSCDGAKFFQTKKPVVQRTSLEGGRNPASVLCSDLKLKVEILRDKHSNEQTFCLFADKSLVDTNAIEKYFQ